MALSLFLTSSYTAPLAQNNLRASLGNLRLGNMVAILKKQGSIAVVCKFTCSNDGEEYLDSNNKIKNLSASSLVPAVNFLWSLPIESSRQVLSSRVTSKPEGLSSD